MFKKLTVLLVAFTMVALAEYPSSLTVKFQVNMAQQVNLGNFNPEGGDYVEVHGNFTDWGSGTTLQLAAGYTNGVDTVIWAGDFVTDMPDTIGTGVVDSVFAYKFVRFPGGNYEDGDNRTLAWDGEADMVEVDLDWFNRTPYANVQETNIVFLVDMAVQIIGGNFTQGSDDVLEVRGGFNGWSDAGDDLTVLEGTTYSLAKVLELSVGADNAYKFVTVVGDVTNWESPISTGGGDRIFTVDGTETDITGDEVPDKFLDIVFWNDEGIEDIFPVPYDITFNVDMTGAEDVNDGTPFNAETDSVYIAGGFNSWLNPGGSSDWTPLAEYKMTPAGDGVYTWTDEFPAGTSRSLKFKFGFTGPNISGTLDNEAGTGEDHITRFEGAGPFTAERVFGTIVDDDVVTDVNDDRLAPVAKAFALADNYPNPFNPTTTIKFEVTVASKVNVVVFNALGQKVKTLFDGNAAVGVNEVVWNGTNDFGSAVASGVYYYQMRVEGKVFTKKMTLIK
jgi:hypothetical protein